MRLGVRRRVLLALLVVFAGGWAPVWWWLRVCQDLVHYYTDFDTYIPLELRWFEALAFLAAVVPAGWLIARWTLAPIRTMTGLVGQLGPTSLGLRLTAEHPTDETGRLAQALNGMLDRIAEGYESQRRFAANASHELRTPLATQRALIEVSLADALTPEQLQLLSRQLLATNERNEALIEGLLALAETERGLMAHVPLRLDAVALQIAERLAPAVEQAGLHMQVRAAPAVVVGERPLLERLVTNLVQNATKYNQPGGRIRVQVAAPGRLMVSNTGPAVPPEAVPGLFEPFRRLSGERLEHGGGAGLGLTIVRSIVAAHEGAVQAVANPDGGLTVTVDLPGGVSEP